MNDVVIISHRGNTRGVDILENKPEFIDRAITKGYDVEVDIRYVDQTFYLGHDTPDYIVDTKWIQNRSKNIWFHCKNLYAAIKLEKMGNIKYFCHSLDPFTTIKPVGLFWVHDLNLKINNSCVIPLLSEQDIEKYNGQQPYAICTDFTDRF